MTCFGAFGNGSSRPYCGRSATPQRRGFGRRSVVVSRFTPDFSNKAGSPGQNPPRLIIPGAPSMTPPAKPGGLIVPGNPGSQSSAPDAATLNRETPVTRVFRPPPGFMDDESGAAGREKSEMPPQEMLNRLQAQAGAWHQLARFLPTLHREGFDGYVIEEATGLERKLQNIWTSAVSIYDSLVKSNSVEPSVMSYYDAPGGEMLLHELRFLSTPQRTVAVTYIAENEFDTAQCAVLAKAMKEHERRGGRREGFTDSPADCLAYKYYRDALECRKVEDIETCVQKGLKVVESDEARAKLESLINKVPQGQQTKEVATLSVLRLTKDEVGCRPVAVAGSFPTVTANAISNSPKVCSEGVFATFTIPAEGQLTRWVPLPAWSIIALAGRPVAMEIKNCADFKPLREASGAKTKDDIKRLQGPGILVVDAEAAVNSGNIDRSSYYAVAKGNDGFVELMAGGQISLDNSNIQVLGPVLFLCRPPVKDLVGTTSSELLSL